MDTELTVVYRNEPVEYFLLRSASSSEAVKKEYKDQCFVIYGKIKYRSSDHKEVRIGMTTNNSQEALICKGSDPEVVSAIADLRIGDRVKVYGQMKNGMLGWSLSIDKIEKTYEDTVSRTAFSVIGGKTVDKEKLEKRNLKGTEVSYYVPKEWKAVEKNLVSEGLGTLEGYQYCLNEINHSSVQPESLFVCYFDSDTQLLRPSEKGQTEQIERAIVQNILGKDPGKAILKKTTSYGPEYHYYHEAFNSSLGKSYHAEFVFQPVETKGFILYLYVYLEKNHLDDVMLLLRMTES